MDKHYQKLRELILKNKENMTGAFKFTVDKYLSSNKKEDVKEYIDTVISQTSDSKRSAEGIWGKEVVDYIVANDLLEKPNGLKLMDILKEIVKEAQRTKKGKKVPAKYLKGLSDKGEYGSKDAMKKEIDKFSGKDEYKKDWKADYKNGKRIKTKKSAATKAFEKKFGKTNEENSNQPSLLHIVQEEGQKLIHYGNTNYFKIDPSNAWAKSSLRDSIKSIPISIIKTFETPSDKKLNKMGKYEKPEYRQYDTGYPIAIKVKNEIILIDGHHRLELAKREGEKNIEVAIKDVTSEYFNNNEKPLDENSDKGITNKAKKSGIPASILRQVYNRGKAAWNSGHRPGVAQDQWAMGRVNSFITGSGGARKADKDLWAKVKKTKKKNP